LITAETLAGVLHVGETGVQTPVAVGDQQKVTIEVARA